MSDKKRILTAFKNLNSLPSSTLVVLTSRQFIEGKVCIYNSKSDDLRTVSQVTSVD